MTLELATVNPEIVGLLAGALTTAAGLPQIMKIIRTGKVRDISLSCYVLLCTGIGLWFAYGLLSGQLAVIFWNGVSLCTNGTVLLLKLWGGENE